MTVDRTLHLHLYLHTRSILSSSVRLNQTGPYHAQNLLLHAAQPLIDAEVNFYHHRPGMGGIRGGGGISRIQGEHDEEEEDEESEGGPAGTWPLGEILQGRHDVMHSRMFNT
jgi:urease accessory protein